MKIKICGLTGPEDALLAASLGATHIGLNFYPPSPRYVSSEQALRVVEAVHALAKPPVLVGIFVNSSARAIRETMKDMGLQLAQLHGDESPQVLNALGARAFKAYRLGQTSLPASLPDLCLLDAYIEGKYGGSGQIADWETAAAVARSTRVLLAGGLTPDNVEAAIRHVRPWGVDVASGVESAPRIKDAYKIRAFISNALAAAEQNFIKQRKHIMSRR